TAEPLAGAQGRFRMNGTRRNNAFAGGSREADAQLTAACPLIASVRRIGGGGRYAKWRVSFLFLVVAFVFVANCSRYSATYECSGVMTNTPITLFIKITQNRWWVFWEPAHDGVLSLEIPSITAPFREALFIVKHIGSYLDLYRWPKGGE